jgi:hypothetical protein
MLREFEADDQGSLPTDYLYALTLALYPSFHFGQPGQEEAKE